jgi:hypothetical protein
MNIKQSLILLGGVAVIATFGYLTHSGAGIQPDEVWRVSVVGGLLALATLGLMWAFRDV